MHHESIESKKYTKKLQTLLLRSIHYDLEDPLFRRITVNHLRLNRTKTCATVYLDLLSIDNLRKRKLIIKKINNLNWLFRNSMRSQLDKYRIPHFRFVEDRVFAQGQKVEELIRQDLANGEGN